MTKIEDRLSLLNYKIDKSYEHITVNHDICAVCPDHFCTFACPAKCYTLIEGQLNFKYDACSMPRNSATPGPTCPVDESVDSSPA